MHATIRRWNAAAPLIAEIERRTQEVENIVSSTPGFVAYHAVKSGDTLISMTVCQDKNGTDEVNRRAAQWVVTAGVVIDAERGGDCGAGQRGDLATAMAGRIERRTEDQVDRQSRFAHQPSQRVEDRHIADVRRRLRRPAGRV